MIDNGTFNSSALSAAELLESLCGCARTRASVPRVTIVCAHPDDEVIGAGGRLPHLGGIRVVHVTDGAPRNMVDAVSCGFTTRHSYARARAAERARALALADVAPERVYDVGIVDQEASFALADLTRHLAGVLDEQRPDIIVTQPYEGGHPDHDATAFAVHGAVGAIRRQGGGVPAIIEMTSYHARGDEIGTGVFLRAQDRAERAVSLCADDRRLKRRMVACYTTQQRVLAVFRTAVERFRLAPAYDFTAPPHAGRLFYEWFDWGMSGKAWRQLASDALRELGQSMVPC